jgi:uncharacterized protein
MPRYFLDSSALVKRYHQESGSPAVDELFQEQSNRFFASRLALVEVHSTFARLVRAGVLSANNLKNLLARLDADVATGALAVAAISSPRLESAAVLLATHGTTLPMRTLDAIHLATAQALQNRASLAAFVAADRQLLQMRGRRLWPRGSRCGVDVGRANSRANSPRELGDPCVSNVIAPRPAFQSGKLVRF